MAKTIAELAVLVEELRVFVNKVPEKKDLTHTQKENMLFKINTILNQMDETIIMLMNMSKLSSSRMQDACLSQLDSLDELKAAILECAKGVSELSKAQAKTWKQLKTRIRSTPEERKEYRQQLVQENIWDTSTRQRSYIPQKFLGIAETLLVMQQNIAFLSTHGLSPCVGYILFSKTKNICVLAHVDDEFSITDGREIDSTTQAEANQFYQEFSQKILTTLGVEKDGSWSAILIVSGHPQSQVLADYLTQGLGVIGVEPIISKTDDWDRGVSVDLHSLSFKEHTEIVPFNELLPDILTLREALNFPDHGLALYRMERSGLVLQDLDAPYVCLDSTVLSRPAPRQQADQDIEHDDVIASRTPTNARQSETTTAYNFPSFKDCYQAVVDCLCGKASEDDSQDDLTEEEREERKPLLEDNKSHHGKKSSRF